MAQDNISPKEEKKGNQEFRGAVFPFFMKFSFFILLFGVLPAVIFIIQILLSNKNIVDQCVTTLGCPEILDKNPTALNSLKESLQQLHLQVGLLFFIFLVFVFSGALIIARSLTRPIQRLSEGMARLRRGDYDVRLPIISRDELGLLSQEFNLMLEQFKEVRQREGAISRTKSEIITLSAHQFRTPLSAMKWALSMIKEEGIDNFKPHQKKLFEQSYAANERMIKLIADMLDVVKIEEGKYGLARKDWDVQEILKEIIKNFEDLVRQKNIKVRVDFPPRPFPILSCDREKLELALNNLLENAINYTMPGGSVFLSLQRAQNMIRIVIQDTGIGIPKEEQGRLFQRFFRASNVLQLDILGSGLGLLIAKNVIEAHQGKIEIQSKEGEGTKATVYLPLRKTRPLPETEAPFRELVGE